MPEEKTIGIDPESRRFLVLGDANAAYLNEIKRNKVLTEALEMVRDADDDCHKDGLPVMRTMPRRKIDSALKTSGRH